MALVWEPVLFQVQHMFHHHMWWRGQLKLCSWELQGADQPFALEVFQHSQVAHDKILLIKYFIILIKYFSVMTSSPIQPLFFSKAVIFFLWILISCSSVYKFALCYADILHGWAQHTMSSWLLTMAFLISLLPATSINLDSLFTAIWWMQILNRVKPSASFTY